MSREGEPPGERFWLSGSLALAKQLMIGPVFTVLLI
jgi:hypothetical protein